MNKLHSLHHQLACSTDYSEWLQIAHEIDDLTGMAQWRENNTSDDYPYQLLEQHAQQLESLINQQDYNALIPFVQESLHRTIGELGNERLYQRALSGTKNLIEKYLNLIVTSLDAVCDNPLKGISELDKLALFTQAEKNFGQPALMLSGGGTFGIYHLGVVHTLLSENVLPNVISGTSMGSITAGVLAVNHDEELEALFHAPEKTHYRPLKRLPLSAALKQRSLLDPKQLYQCIQANIGDVTFQEAYDKTGREVSITVSPVRSGQKPRILNHKTAPNVLIAHASKASCSVPGLFPPTTLMAKSASGVHVPYMKSERWVDGSFATDIPRQRIGRLHNVNYFIVSQANPHIVPFVSQYQQTGLPALIKDAAITSAYAQGNALLKVARRRLHKQPWRSWLDHSSFLLDQDYLGDINIHPQFPPSWYLKFMKNPTLEEFHYLLKMGERSTWPQLAMIRDQTRISRALQACITKLSTGKVATKRQ